MRPAFHHEAVFYASEREYLAGTIPEIEGALAADGTVLVAVDEAKTRLLRSALGGRADRVRFTDMERLGRNPACIIPAWREFVSTGAGPLLGIGEPVWPGRSADELIECRRHEALLNLAFDGGGEWRLLCPYDATALDDAVLSDARHNHPHVCELGVSGPSADYVEPQSMLAWDEPTPAPADAAELAFTRADLALVRAVTAAHASGLAPDRRDDLVLAVNELAANSMRHGGGRGVLRTWRDAGSLVCEVADGGRIADPLAGRELPPARITGGRGLWMVNHLCDLVEVRTTPDGNTVRLRMTAH